VFARPRICLNACILNFCFLLLRPPGPDHISVAMKTTIGFTYNHNIYMKSVRGKFNYVRDEVTRKAGGVSVSGRKRAKPGEAKSRVTAAPGPSALALAGPSTSAAADFLFEEEDDDDDDEDQAEAEVQAGAEEQSEAEDSDKEQPPKGKKSAKVRNTVNTL
jgi:hypothetical protein